MQTYCRVLVRGYMRSTTLCEVVTVIKDATFGSQWAYLGCRSVGAGSPFLQAAFVAGSLWFPHDSAVPDQCGPSVPLSQSCTVCTQVSFSMAR